MKTQTLVKRVERMPSVFEDFFSPWNDWFNGGLTERMLPRISMNVPAVNITERKDDYLVSMAAPGLKKEDFEITLEGNLLTISSQKEERTDDENGDKFTRREYSYSSFERCFSLPEEVNMDKIDAKYQDGVLNVVLHKKEEARKMLASKQIAVK